MYLDLFLKTYTNRLILTEKSDAFDIARVRLFHDGNALRLFEHKATLDLTDVHVGLLDFDLLHPNRTIPATHHDLVACLVELDMFDFSRRAVECEHMAVVVVQVFILLENVEGDFLGEAAGGQYFVERAERQVAD